MSWSLPGRAFQQCREWFLAEGLARVAVAVIVLGAVTALVALAIVGWEEAAAVLFDLVTGAKFTPPALGVAALACAILCSCSPLVFVWQVETVSVIAGFFLGWFSGARAALGYEMLLLYALACLRQSRDGAALHAKFMELFPGALRFATRAGASAEERGEAWRGVLFGFLALPAVMKDFVAAFVLELPTGRLLLLRVPSAAFYAAALAYFGHKARLLAPALVRRGGGAGEVATVELGGDEALFGLVVALGLGLAAAFAHREYGMSSGGADCERGSAAGGLTSGTAAHAWTPLKPLAGPL